MRKRPTWRTFKCTQWLWLDDNEGKNFDGEKHSKILSGVLINNNERQSQNKNRTLNFTGSKSSSPRHETNFEKVLIEKTEQPNWTLLIARKICKKMCRAWRNLYQIPFLSQGKWWTKIHHVTPQITLTELGFQFANVTHQI